MQAAINLKDSKNEAKKRVAQGNPFQNYAVFHHCSISQLGRKIFSLWKHGGKINTMGVRTPSFWWAHHSNNASWSEAFGEKEAAIFKKHVPTKQVLQVLTLQRQNIQPPTQPTTRKLQQEEQQPGIQTKELWEIGNARKLKKSSLVLFLREKAIFFNGDSLPARLNSHYQACSYKKKKHNLKPPFANLREQELSSVVYVDDTLLEIDTSEERQDNVFNTLTWLEDLVFCIHQENFYCNTRYTFRIPH